MVISSAAYHENRSDLIVLAMTSQLWQRSGWGTITVQDWESSGLSRPSYIKPVVNTFVSDRVIRRLGHLDDGTKALLVAVLPTLVEQLFPRGPYLR